jgi:ABC-type phosphate transport system substrate-binding protein
LLVREKLLQIVAGSIAGSQDCQVTLNQLEKDLNKEAFMSNRWKLLLGIVGFLLIAPTWQSIAADAPSGALIVRGANAMAGLVDEWAKTFAEANPGVRIMVSGGGTAGGFEALFDKAVPLIMATRKINEKEIQAATLSGVKYSEM